MTQFSLKLLALLFMLCDHFSKVVLSTGVLAPILGTEGNLWLRTMLTVVGRKAFPMFAWFTAEGCRKTANFPRYLLRLLVFAALSELPFQLCFYGAGESGFRLACHNVIFTLLLAAMAIYVGKLLEKRRVPRLAALLMPGALAVILGWVLKMDYNAWGVALILLLYALPEEKPRLILLAAWFTVFQLIWHGFDGQTLVWLTDSNQYGILLQWIGGMFAVPLLATYNGEKGRRGKWLFYIFYPAHLAALYGLRMLFLMG